MKNNKQLGSLLGVAILMAASSAFAANNQPGTTEGSTSTPSVVLTATPVKSDVAKPDGTAMRHMLPPEAVVGKDVTNTMGETIGKVTKIDGEKVVVAVGGFLGLGAYDVALDWSQFTTSGEDDDIKLQTSMSKDQLKKMPEYKG
jgi:hypothetical protein